MIEFKEEIAKSISEVIELDLKELIESIEVPKDEKQGDYAFPCFRLAKILKKSPQIIAEEISSKIKYDSCLIDKIEVINGYLNFFINKESLVKTVIQEVKNKQNNYGKSTIGNRKKYSYRLFFSKYSKTISYRAFKNNINRKCTIQYI